MARTSDQIQAISRVWQLPPIESFRKWVSLEDLYGTCFVSFLDSPTITCMPQSKESKLPLMSWILFAISSAPAMGPVLHKGCPHEAIPLVLPIRDGWPKHDSVWLPLHACCNFGTSHERAHHWCSQNFCWVSSSCATSYNQRQQADDIVKCNVTLLSDRDVLKVFLTWGWGSTSV